MSWRYFITFRLDHRLLGIDVQAVKEINRVIEMTPVPLSPEMVVGLINLRGQIVTIIDLAGWLGLNTVQPRAETHSVILKWQAVGFLVDDIGDMITIDGDEIEPPPANLSGIEGEFIHGVIKMEDELVVLLNPERFLVPDSGLSSRRSARVDGVDQVDEV